MSQQREENLERTPPDAVLVDMARRQADRREGREAASRLLQRYREPVFHWCLRRVRDPELALDLAQDALLNAYRNLERFDGRARFSSWLFAIARNRCLNALRRPALFEGDGFDADTVADPRGGQDLDLEDREAEERILDLIREHLPPLDQQVLWLRCFERMPVDAITDALAIPEASGARGVLQRARRRLRAALETSRAAEGDAKGAPGT
ncbi:MAG: sigma-70 family RNA polymerase sigma factor [Candidatus Krumholzibacteriota bacterium]|nr:sigma-70 family RNA polymerase sigma factor [Candidatus Krumholzibacteriota bacterium]